jgi:threonine dehydrogenase-like Zn-dependent dehydrogenase
MLRCMRHLVWVENGKLEWQDAPDPEPGPGEAVIRPLAVARCDLDPIMAAFGVFPGPYPVGHEVAGEVIAVGEGVARHRPGDRVVVPFQVSCGGCEACRDTRFAACHTYMAKAGAAYGFGPAGGDHGGAVADRLLIPAADHLLHPAPEGIDPVALCVLPDNALDAYRAVGPPLAARPGADVTVVGGDAPSIGLYAVAWAAALGAGHVRYVDADEGRLAQAARLGAEAVARPQDEPWPRRFGRAAIVVANTADPEGLQCALRSTDDYGTCTLTAIFFQPAELPLLALYTRGVTLEVGRADSRRHLAAVLRHVAAGRFDPAAVETTVVPLDDAAEAWLQPATKLVLRA